MHLLALLDQPHHLLRGVADLLGRARRGAAARAAATGRPASAALRSTHTSSRSRISSSRSSRWLTSAARLWSLNSSAEYGEPDRDLGHVLHLDQHVDGAVEVGGSRDRRRCRAGATRARRRARAARRCRRRAPQDQHVVGQQHVVAVGVDHPLLAAPDRHHAHADLDRQLDVGERAVRERGVGAHAHAVRDLLGRGEVGDERGGDAEPVGDDAGDVDRGVAHALDRREHVQHARHLLGVARRAGREHADLAHLVHEVREPLLELVDLVGHRLVAEEEGGVRQVDHELGGVLGLREHGLEICGVGRLVPSVASSRITASTGATGRSPWKSAAMTELTLPAFSVAPADAPARPRVIVVHEGNGMSAQLIAVLRAPRPRGLPGDRARLLLPLARGRPDRLRGDHRVDHPRATSKGDFAAATAALREPTGHRRSASPGSAWAAGSRTAPPSGPTTSASTPRCRSTAAASPATSATCTARRSCSSATSDDVHPDGRHRGGAGRTTATRSSCTPVPSTASCATARRTTTRRRQPTRGHGCSRSSASTSATTHDAATAQRTAQVRPRATIARISANAPSRSRLDVTIGIPWLSGSSPSR